MGTTVTHIILGVSHLRFQDIQTRVYTLGRSTTRIFPMDKPRTGSNKLLVSFTAILLFLCRSITLKAIIVQGKSISLPSGIASYAAIDTGTTLVAGPAASIAAIYAQIPGSQPGTGSWEGFYSYRKYDISLWNQGT